MTDHRGETPEKRAEEIENTISLKLNYGGGCG